MTIIGAMGIAPAMPAAAGGGMSLTAASAAGLQEMRPKSAQHNADNHDNRSDDVFHGTSGLVL